MAESELLQDFPMQWALDRQLIANEHYRLGVNWFKLATNSAFFREKLRDIPRDDSLILNCCNLSMLNTAVYFCHMGVSDVDLNEDTLEHNALVATDYEINELRKLCCDFVKANLTEDNVWSMWRATKRACKEIKQIVFDFILRNFLTVSLKHEFVELSVEELRDFLIDDYLNITETQLMETLDRWVSHAPKRRTHHFDTLFSRVRLGNLSIEQLESLNHSPFIRKARSSGSLRALHQVKRNILRTRKNLRPLDNILLGSYQPRIPHDSIFIFGGYEQGTDVTRTVQVFDSRRNTWITHSEYQTDASSICLPKPRMSFGIVIIENCIYLVGGEYAEGKATQEVMAYDLKQQTWNRRAPMHEVRRDLSAVVVGNYLYAIGGDNNNNVLKSVERYCAQMNQWTERSSMHLRRAAAAATVLNDIIFVCGGYTELYMEAVSNSCESYNPQTDQWSYINPMTEMRSYIQAVAFDGFVYVLGGAEEQQWTNTERYNPVDNVWQRMPSMQQARADFAACVFQGEIICLGGGFDSNCTTSVERWQPSTNTWVEGVALPQPVWGHRCICVHGVENLLPHLKRGKNLASGDDHTATSATPAADPYRQIS